MFHIRTVYSPALTPDTYEQHRVVLARQDEVLWAIVHDPRYEHAGFIREDLPKILGQLESGRDTHLFVEPLDHHQDFLWGKVIGVEFDITKERLEDPRVADYLKKPAEWQLAYLLRLVDLRVISHEVFKRVRPLVDFDRRRYGSYGRPFPCPVDFDDEAGLAKAVAGKDIGLHPLPKYFGHNRDFSIITIRGKKILCTKAQAAMIKCLVEAWRSGKPVLSQKTLLTAAGNPGGKISQFLRSRPELKDVIKYLGGGHYRLAAEVGPEFPDLSGGQGPEKPGDFLR